MPWGPSQGEKIWDLEEEMSRPIDIGDIVFAFRFPLPNREMNPWLQFMIVTMQLDIMFEMDNAISKSFTNCPYAAWSKYLPVAGLAFLNGF